ncbi:YsnF/AvaK domain-containing protein [Pararhizobium gei]|uniref:YsnF/AvaK domain-containing protein n=1 Tax=Pararhizobium gei TaxID=1395951 RepID=UPI0023DA2214|nr:DUF2382 domain-containing protein [Rhizobium gei]
MSYADQTTSTVEANTITAFFDSRTDADHAVERLVEAGIARDAVRVIASGSDETVSTTDESKGFWASLADLFMPEEDRNVYAEGIRRGGYLVTVSGYPASMHDVALDILDDEGSIDLDERSQSWESEGWSRSTSNGDFAESTYDRSSGTTGASTSLATDREDVIPVVEEELRVGKRDVNNGRIRVRSYVTETPVSENVSLRDENVEVTRRAVDRPVSGADTAFVDRTIEAEEHREEATISKDARVVEEIALRKTAEERSETISDTIRKTEVEIEDDRNDGSVRKDGTLGIRRD